MDGVRRKKLDTSLAYGYGWKTKMNFKNALESTIKDFIDSKKYYELKYTGTISEGLMPKLHNCFESLEKGVQEIRIGNSSIFSQKNQFTKIKK